MTESDRLIEMVLFYEKEARNTRLPWHRKHYQRAADRFRIYARMAQITERIDGLERGKTS